MGFFELLFGKSIFGRSTVSAQTESKICRDWETINMLLKQKSPAQLKQALIAADKTLDNALRDISSGETMAERLKTSRNRFDPIVYNKIWEAHKLRNNVVHELDFEPQYFMLTEAVEKLRRALNVLGVKV